MRKFSIAIFSMFFVLFFSKTVFAATINEVEPNDSASVAQLIQVNNEDPSKVVNGNYDGQNVLIGNITSSTDEDWYKVYLPANSNTILGINSSALSSKGMFDIYDENLNLVKSISYQKNSAYFGATPYYINIPSSGYYYVKVYSPLTTGEYRFFIGGPDYTVNSYTYNAPSVLTLTPTTSTVQAVYDLRNIASIPNNAVLYYWIYVNILDTKS